MQTRRQALVVHLGNTLDLRLERIVHTGTGALLGIDLRLCRDGSPTSAGFRVPAALIDRLCDTLRELLQGSPQ